MIIFDKATNEVIAVLKGHNIATLEKYDAVMDADMYEKDGKLYIDPNGRILDFQKKLDRMNKKIRGDRNV